MLEPVWSEDIIKRTVSLLPRFSLKSAIVATSKPPGSSRRTSSFQPGRPARFVCDGQISRMLSLAENRPGGRVSTSRISFLEPKESSTPARQEVHMSCVCGGGFFFLFVFL